jgi:hypothetical protein
MLSKGTVANLGANFTSPALANGVRVAGDVYPTETRDFAFQLNSGIFGLLATKALPLSRINGRIQIRIQLNTALKAFVSNNVTNGIGNVTNFKISNLYYNAKISQLSPDIDMALSKMAPVIMLPAIAYKIDSIGIPSGSSSFRFPLNFSFSSVKAIYFFFQNQAVANGTLASKAITQRIFNNLKNYSLQINGVKYFSESIEKVPRMFLELKRSFDCLNDPNNLTSFTIGNYAVGVSDDNGIPVIGGAPSADANVKLFCAGLDLDRFNHSSHLMISGTNFVDGTIDLTGEFSAATTEAVTMYAMVMYDVNYMIDQSGMMSVRA